MSPQPLGDPKTLFDPDALARGTTPANGTVLLADQGCGSISVLVVNGPWAGEVWTIGGGMVIPEASSFVGWIERWLRDATARWASDVLPRIVDGDVPTAELDRPVVVHYATAALEWRAAGTPLDFTLYEGALPSPAEAARARGLLAAMRGDRAAAEVWLGRAAPLEEEEPVARAALDRARVADIAKDPEGVLAATGEGLAGPKPWAVTESLLLRYRMRAFDDLGRKDEALEVAERRAEKTYFVHAPHYALARRWIARGDWAEVERVLLRAAARAPSTMERGATPRAVAIAVLEPFAARLEKDGHGDRVVWARDLALRFAEGPPAPF